MGKSDSMQGTKHNDMDIIYKMQDPETEKLMRTTRRLLDMLLNGDLPAETAGMVRDWFAEDNSRRLKDDALYDIFGRTVSAGTPSQAALRKYSELAARLDLPESDVVAPAARGSRQPLRRATLRVAAVLAPIIVLAGAMLFLLADRAPQDKIAAETIHTTISVPQGALQEDVTLADGSQMRVAPGGSISYGDNPRKVELEGGAWFNVEKSDKGEPFTVKTKHVLVTVHGTEFRVAESEQMTLVALFAGSVSIEAADQSVTLAPGQIASFDHAKMKFDTERIFTPSYGGMLFEDTPLGKILDAVEIVYDLKIERDPAIPMSETYHIDIARGEKISTVLDILSHVSGKFDYAITDDSIKLKHK